MSIYLQVLGTQIFVRGNIILATINTYVTYSLIRRKNPLQPIILFSLLKGPDSCKGAWEDHIYMHWPPHVCLAHSLVLWFHADYLSHSS